MSDSELSVASHTPVPPDDEIEQSLRREVVRATKAGEDFSLRQIRTASEKKLSLPDGFYKGHETWKAKSKDVVQDQMENEPEVPSSPAQAKKAGAAVKAKKPAPKSSKRQSEEAVAPASKKRKTKSEDSSEELSSPLSEIGSVSEPETKPKKTTKPRKSVEKKSATSKKPAKSKLEKDDDLNEGGGDRDSDLSDVIDEELKPKRKGKARDSQDGKSSKPKSVKSKAPAEEDPDQAEIKRLQGWLVKCGIRKIWGIELKPFETPKAKIKHLKDMLSEAGMTGRYSQEKATEIKEAREMAADIEAIQEGEQRWGKEDEEETKEGERPQRRLVRGAKNYDFLSSDGEETD